MYIERPHEQLLYSSCDILHVIAYCDRNIKVVHEGAGYTHDKFSIKELENVISNAKVRIACGIDNLPNEILKCRCITMVLFNLFQIVVVVQEGRM